MVDVDLIKRKLLLLENNRRQLENVSCDNLESFKKDVMLQKAVEKLLEELIQICIDIGKHIVADERMQMPDDNKGIFDVLAENGVLKEETTSLMKNMVGFRNVLVHMYERIDVESVYVNFKKRLGDFDSFVREIDAYIMRTNEIAEKRRD